ncbi:nitrate/nitrite transporter [Microbacterium sp. SLBN-146]|uniref:MFS transporter n=1 Tax=Microbacterium sp. SLBN-146 TaxID=2768457 RepID=UPI0011549BA6|nr:MFS transporter [Microbacterium sp. SLBN-146]TQJ29894.1 putative MFS family arabinose efflux permease [Microbacterium sp. SLBN-146]
MSLIARDGGKSTLLISIGATVVSGIPAFLIGALFTQINGDIGIPSWSLGVIVATYWVFAALSSTPSGRLTANIGSRKVIILTIVVAMLSLVGAALVTPSWQWFLVWAAVGGVATGLCHPSTNHLINLRVSGERRALAYGVKQSAIPLASFLAGLAIPAIALTLGWRWAYALAAGIAAVVLVVFFLVGPRRLPKGTVRKNSSAPLTREQRVYFLTLASVTTLGAGSAACASTFGVVSAIEHGMHPAVAGVLFAAASLTGAFMRIAVGALERGGGNTMRTITVMLAAGLVGSVLMAFTREWAFGIGLVLVLGVGWGWTGLTHYVVSSTAGRATPAATGLVQTGSYLGCAILPIVGGALFAVWGSTPIWYLSGVGFLVATTLAIVVWRRGAPAAV